MFEQIKGIIVDTINCAPEQVTMEANLYDDLSADSLDAVELNLALEEKCGVSIPDEVMAEMTTVGDIVKYVEENK